MTPIQALDHLAVSLSATAPMAGGPPDNPFGFAKALGEVIERANTAQFDAEKLARAYQSGAEGVSLESSMIAMQEANVSLQFLVQARNRVVSAYHDIMNMPV